VKHPSFLYLSRLCGGEDVVELEVKIVFRDTRIDVLVDAIYVTTIYKPECADKALVTKMLEVLLEGMVERWLGGEEK